MSVSATPGRSGVTHTPPLFAYEQDTLTTDDYYTPAWVFERMGLTFDLDVCAPPGGVDWVPAVRYYTKADDGLSQPWNGRVWMNPPYSRSAPWVDRFIEHRHGVCLVQVSRAAPGSAIWNAADAIMFAGTFQFAVPAGLKLTHHARPGEIFMPVWFAAFGVECAEAISRLGVVRKVAS